MLIIGSKALKMRFPKYRRVVNDIDIICFSDDIYKLIGLLNPKEVKNGKYSTILKNIQNKNEIFDKDNVEIIFADKSQSLQKYLDYDKDNIFASIEVLFSLKKSHIHHPRKFLSNIRDYVLLHNHLDGEDILSTITKIHTQENINRLGNLKTPSLDKSVKDFFGQSKNFVNYIFDHDDLHKIMSHYDRPLFERIQKDKSRALCNEDMWNQLVYEDKCKCVLEEAYVIALERKIIPMIFDGGKGYTSQEAFNWALMRICTTLCSGWFREFAKVNFFKIKGRMNINYVEKFLTEYENGNIRRQKGNPR